jgi:oxygen-independent coproporphyrinogen-3 oxidase
MYREARSLLAGEGFGHYEISNWARPGFECRHNTDCWMGGYYMAIGPGAHGHYGSADGNVRYANGPSVGEWIQAASCGVLPAGQSEVLDEAARDREMVYTSIRMMRGLDTACIGEKAREVVLSSVPRLIGMGLVLREGQTVRLTKHGELFADRVALELI